MTTRSIRRAMERKAAKQLRKQALRPEAAAVSQDNDIVAQSESVLPEAPIPSSSPARLAANRRNAQHSTGPKTFEGRAKASLNAVKTGLTGRTVLLPTDDALMYQQHIDRFFSSFKPATTRESELVQSLADAQWRLYRVPELEAGIYALARIEFADMFAAYEPAEAASLMQAHTFLTYHKQLNNLSVQEARLHRQYARDLKTLSELQQLRATIERRRKAQADAAAAAAAECDADGFVFATAATSPDSEPLWADLEDEPLTLAA